MEVRLYEPADLMALRLQPMQACLGLGGQTEENAKGLNASQDAYTVTVDGDVVACLGLVEFWPGRRQVWAYLSAMPVRQLLQLTRLAERWLRYHGDGRIEASIDPTFRSTRSGRPNPSERWAQRLGFKYEGRMAQYIPGNDFLLYARIGN